MKNAFVFPLIDANGQVKVLDEKVRQVYGLKKGDRKMG